MIKSIDFSSATMPTHMIGFNIAIDLSGSQD